MGYLVLILETIFVFLGIVILFTSRPVQAPQKYIILAVKDQESSIEGIVLNLKGALKKSAFFSQNQKLLIVDFSSSDNTFKILEKLSKNNDFFDLVRVKAD